MDCFWPMAHFDQLPHTTLFDPSHRVVLYWPSGQAEHATQRLSFVTACLNVDAGQAETHLPPERKSKPEQERHPDVVPLAHVRHVESHAKHPPPLPGYWPTGQVDAQVEPWRTSGAVHPEHSFACDPVQSAQEMSHGSHVGLLVPSLPPHVPVR